MKYIIFSGTYLQPYLLGGILLGIAFFRGHTCSPILFRDRLGLVPLIGTDIGHTFFIQGWTCQRDFPGTHLQPYLLRDRLAANFYSGTHFEYSILPGTGLQTFFLGTDLQPTFIQGQTYQKNSQGHTCSHIYSGTHLPKRFFLGHAAVI